MLLGNPKKHVLKSKMARIKCILRWNAFLMGTPVLHPTFSLVVAVQQQPD